MQPLEALAGGISISDFCTADASLTVTHSDAVIGACPIVITRTYTVADPCGNSVTVNHTINVDDTQAPVVTGLLSATTVEGCNAGAAPAAVGTVAALEALAGGISINDLCTADASLTVSHSDAVNGTCPIVITRTYTVTDACGNSVTVNHTINVDDTQAPVVTGSLSATTLEGCSAGAAPAAVGTVAALEALTGGITVNDLCTADASLTVTHSDAVNGTCPIVITRTYTVTDACGNSVTVNHTINVDDTQAPVLTGSLSATTVEGCNAGAAPAAVGTVAALEALSGGISINDLCTADASLAVTHSDVVNGTCPVVITRTYTVTDECGNFVTVNHTINVDDTQAPVVTGSLSATTVEGCSTVAAPAAATTAAALEAMTGGITIADACTPDASLTVTNSDIVDGTCPIHITRTYTITDACGNVTNLLHEIYVDDTTPPTFTAPANITIFKDAACGYDASVTVTGDVTDEADLCDVTLNATFTDLVSNGTCVGEQIITRTWSLTDDCGNTTTHLQVITVRDNIAPTFTVPANITIYKDAACGYDASVAITGDVTDESDNCVVTLNATFTDLLSNGSCVGEQIITRTWSLTDDCGNMTTDVQIITIKDNSAPTFTVPADIIIYKDATCGFDASISITGDVTDEADNCDASLNATYSDLVSNGGCVGEQIITRTWSLTDDCGNTITHGYHCK
ncbi:MAG: hypothetical protein IPJ37_02130 [Bacteroidales bacterium]|nr:hypothetical protein [Bacteroidales bacterium]